jgi:hypothetical protein
LLDWISVVSILVTPLLFLKFVTLLIAYMFSVYFLINTEKYFKTGRYILAFVIKISLLIIFGFVMCTTKFELYWAMFVLPISLPIIFIDQSLVGFIFNPILKSFGSIKSLVDLSFTLVLIYNIYQLDLFLYSQTYGILRLLLFPLIPTLSLAFLKSLEAKVPKSRARLSP